MWSIEIISFRRFQPRPHLAVLALVSFALSFIVARVFTYLHPDFVLVSGGIHIHHFWFGLALLAIGGWLGISYTHKEIDMLAAIIYGVGGGLIADEVGLLLTFGNYYSELTWTFVLLSLAFISTLVLLYRYRQSIFEELHGFVGRKASICHRSISHRRFSRVRGADGQFPRHIDLCGLNDCWCLDNSRLFGSPVKATSCKQCFRPD